MLCCLPQIAGRSGAEDTRALCLIAGTLHSGAFVWCGSQLADARAEAEPLPGDWKRLGPFDRLLVIRCIRPDRMAEALGTVVGDVIGSRYTISASFDLGEAYKDSRPDVPMFVFLSPGVDVMSSIEALQKEFVAANPESTIANKILSVSLGQGQEPVANRAIATAHKSGGWVALQNIHLTPKWTKDSLEKRLDKLADGSNPSFRLFLSAEPHESITGALPGCTAKQAKPPRYLERCSRSQVLEEHTTRFSILGSSESSDRTSPVALDLVKIDNPTIRGFTIRGIANIPQNLTSPAVTPLA